MLILFLLHNNSNNPIIISYGHTSGFTLLQAYKKLSLFMTILAKNIMTFL